MCLKAKLDHPYIRDGQTLTNKTYSSMELLLHTLYNSTSDAILIWKLYWMVKLEIFVYYEMRQARNQFWKALKEWTKNKNNKFLYILKGFQEAKQMLFRW